MGTVYPRVLQAYHKNDQQPGTKVVYEQLLFFLMYGPGIKNDQKPSRGVVHRDGRTTAAVVLLSGWSTRTPCLAFFCMDKGYL